MDKSTFYTSIRKRNSGVFGTSLSQSQVNGLETILTEAEKRRTSLKWLAYMLATTYHETAHTMQPIAEYGKGKGRKYGVKGKYGQVPFGRGYVQLTWDYNYERADLELGLRGALLANFNLALKPEIAVQILFKGMVEGWFTGKKLSDYIDYLPMRRIINGTDKASLISGYAVAFESALRAGGYGQRVQLSPVQEMNDLVSQKQPELTVKPVSVAPVTVKQSPFAAFVAFILALFKRK